LPRGAGAIAVAFTDCPPIAPPSSVSARERVATSTANDSTLLVAERQTAV
jgi:hypothetical protein